MEYREISGILKKSERSTIEDIKTFKAWERGEISIRECYSQFMKNNGYKYDIGLGDYNTPWLVPRHLFKKWLNSLGYIRGVSDGEE